MEKLDEINKRLEKEIEIQNACLEEKEEYIAALESEVNEYRELKEHSIGFKCLMKVYAGINFLMPAGSRRRKAVWLFGKVNTKMRWSSVKTLYILFKED